jgi:aminodeoxyfutalosine synthase
MLLDLRRKNSPLADIVEKVEAGERLSREDGIRLFQSNDILTIGYMADLVRRRKVGDYAYFINNYHINHTNVCYAGCTFCAFAKYEREEGAYTMDMAQIEAECLKAKAAGATEVHVIGGLNPRLSYEYYLDVVRTIRRILPDAQVQAYDAVEIEFIARRAARKPVAEVLKDLMDAGMTALPGGGGEVFSPRVKQLLYPNKIGRDEYLAVHRIAHSLGLKSNASILYGHIETYEERIDHMLDLRALQDETGGFECFISFPFHKENTPLAKELAEKGTPLHDIVGFEDIKHHAIARLMLDNFPHIRIFWMGVTMKLAQTALAFGVDDLDGTVKVERIIHDAGAKTPQEAGVEEMVYLIKSAGRIPVERDTHYKHLRVWA